MIQNPQQIQKKIVLTLTKCSTLRFRVVFGLFGWSENSSFPSTLRAWFAFAHSSPYRKSNRNDKGIGCSPPYPSPSWGGYLANPLPKLRGNRQNAPSPDWGRLGWGTSRKGLFLVVVPDFTKRTAALYCPFPDLGKAGMGSVPQGLYFVVILNSGAKRSVIQNPLHWGWTSSPSPAWGRLGWGTSRKGFNPYRHSGLYKANRRSVFAPSPTWGRSGWGASRKGLFLLRHSVLDKANRRSVLPLPRLGEGWDGEHPVRAAYCVILNSGAKRSVIQNPLHGEN